MEQQDQKAAQQWQSCLSLAEDAALARVGALAVEARQCHCCLASAVRLECEKATVARSHRFSATTMSRVPHLTSATWPAGAQCARGRVGRQHHR